MGLLAHVGIDAAGAVQLTPTDEHDEAELSAEGSVEQLDDSTIAAPQALSQASKESALEGDDALFAGALTDRAHERTDALRAQLDRHRG